MSENFHYTWIASLLLALVCIPLSVLVTLNEYNGLTYDPWIVLSLLALYVAAFCWHLRGYVELGKRNDIPMLSAAARAVTALFGFFGLSVIIFLFIFAYGSPVLLGYAAALTSVLVILLAIPTLFFIVGAVAAYREIGSLHSAIAVCIVPIAVLCMWNPWPTMLISLLSSYAFYRIDLRSHHAHMV